MYSKVINSTHIYIPVDQVKNLDHARILNTATSKFGDTEISMFDETRSGYFGVPRYYFKNLVAVTSRIIDETSNGESLGAKFTSEYWPGQLEVLEQFARYYKAGKTGFIFEAPPGFGKTVCLIRMILAINKTTLVVVPRSNLVKQWVERLLEHSNLKKKDIGVVINGKAVWRGKKVVVGLVHTLALDRFGEDFKSNFGTAIYDEVDRSVPPATFAPVVMMFPTKYRIGASATIVRQDGLDVIFQRHIGECWLFGSDANRMEPKVLIHEFNGNSGYVHAQSAKLNRRGMLLSKLAINPARNAVLARYIQMIYKTGRRTLVLSDRTDQLVMLRGLVHTKFGIPFNEMGYYVRKLPKDTPPWEKQKYRTVKKGELERVSNNAKIIFATYGMFALGTDIPDLAGLVYATPQSATEQSRGRIERVLKGKKQPVIVDLVDTVYGDARRWGRSRRNEYEKKGLKIKVYK